jgi:hypothetical protein
MDKHQRRSDSNNPPRIVNLGFAVRVTKNARGNNTENNNGRS